MSVQNEVELLQIEAYLLQIWTAITKQCTKTVYSGRVIFIEIEDRNYEFLNKQFLKYREDNFYGQVYS